MSRPKEHGRTSTLEILGQGQPGKTPRKWGEHFKRLTALREEFLRGKNAHSQTAKEEFSWFSEHMADAATDSYDRDCALALLSSSQNALYEIDQALKRIRDGTYGICELTQAPIEAERLKAIPWTRYCIAAQAQVEARKGAPRVKLGRVGTCISASDGHETDDEADEVIAAEPEREAA